MIQVQQSLRGLVFAGLATVAFGCNGEVLTPSSASDGTILTAGGDSTLLSGGGDASALVASPFGSVQAPAPLENFGRRQQSRPPKWQLPRSRDRRRRHRRVPRQAGSGRRSRVRFRQQPERRSGGRHPDLRDIHRPPGGSRRGSADSQCPGPGCGPSRSGVRDPVI